MVLFGSDEEICMAPRQVERTESWPMPIIAQKNIRKISVWLQFYSPAGSWLWTHSDFLFIPTLSTNFERINEWPLHLFIRFPFRWQIFHHTYKSLNEFFQIRCCPILAKIRRPPGHAWRYPQRSFYISSRIGLYLLWVTQLGRSLGLYARPQGAKLPWTV